MEMKEAQTWPTELWERQRPERASVQCDGSGARACLAVLWGQLGRETGKVFIALIGRCMRLFEPNAVEKIDINLQRANGKKEKMQWVKHGMEIVRQR